jgi:hypothetical protein
MRGRMKKAFVAVLVVAGIAKFVWDKKGAPSEVWVIAPPAGKVDVAVDGKSAHAESGRVARVEVERGQRKVQVGDKAWDLDVESGSTTWLVPAVPGQCLVQIDVTSMYGKNGQKGHLEPRVLARGRGDAPMLLPRTTVRPHYGTDLALFPESIQKYGLAVLVGQVPCDELNATDQQLFAMLTR